MTSRELVEMGEAALRDRIEWEKKMAKFELQRNAQDRPRVQNAPWANASNARYPFSDMMIEQDKAFMGRIPFSTERLATFKALIPSNVPLAAKASAYYDFLVKEKTEFEIQQLYCLDAGLQDGESYMKILWDPENEVPIFRFVDALQIIYPATVTNLAYSPWIIHVVQLTEDEARNMLIVGDPEKRKWKDLPGFEDFIKTAQTDSKTRDKNDTAGREEDRYNREGINRTNVNSETPQRRLLVWEVHYEEDGQKKIRTTSPDVPDFDFQDSRDYPYHSRTINMEDGKLIKKWMFEQYRREYINPHCHSSRGICELLQEAEFMMSSTWRQMQNVKTLTAQPMFTSPQGLPPGSTQNIPMVPGAFLPSGMQAVTFPDITGPWIMEMQMIRQIYERRLAAPDVASSKGNAMHQGESKKTARQISYEAGMQNLSVDYKTMSWKKFLKSVLRQGWERVCQFKPKSLVFYMQETFTQLDSQALNNDYLIDVSWSADSINTEFLNQRAIALFQLTANNPFANGLEAWKNVVEQLAPGQAQRFVTTPQQAGMQMQQKIGMQIDMMTNTGFPAVPEQNDDHFMAVQMTMTFIKMRQETGAMLLPKQVELLSLFMQAHRQMLKEQDPQKSKQLEAMLNQADVQAHGEFVAQQQREGNVDALARQIIGNRAMQGNGNQ